MSQFKVGDTVQIRPEFAKTVAHKTAVYEVVKVNPRTLGLKNKSTGAAMKADPECVMACNSAGVTVEEIAIPSSPLVGPAPAFEIFDKGTVVKMKGKGDTLFVVVGDTDKGYRLYTLGGSTRYYTGVPISYLTRVNEIDGWKTEDPYAAVRSA